MKINIEQAELTQLREDIHQLVEDLNGYHKQLREFEKKIENLKSVAEELGLDQVKFALRDAYARVSMSGSNLVEAHIALNIPPTVFQK